jgi:DNA (cytosine-5)-methyltransferase 1
VTPYYYCAANAIDWSLPAPRIGDRVRPLKDKTRKRIEIGLKKFGRQAQLVGNYSPGWTRPVTQPTGTVTGADHHALVTPPMLVNFVQSGSDGSRASSVDGPWPTQVANVHHALVTPPFTIETQWSHAEGDRSSGIEEALPTQTAQMGRALVTPPFVVNMQANNPPTALDEPMPTMLTGNHRYVVVPPYLVDLRGENAPKQVSNVLSTVAAGGNHHGVVLPPSFLTSFYGTIQQSGIEEPVPTQPSIDKHALVTMPFLVGTYGPQGQKVAVSVDSPSPTITGTRTWALAAPGEAPAVDDCGFRMLQPHEIGAAMAFPDSYTVLGTQRDKVKQYGNAVTPPVMRWLVERCLETLK